MLAPTFPAFWRISAMPWPRKMAPEWSHPAGRPFRRLCAYAMGASGMIRDDDIRDALLATL
jgi:hypothetical protein